MIQKLNIKCLSNATNHYLAMSLLLYSYFSANYDTVITLKKETLENAKACDIEVNNEDHLENYGLFSRINNFESSYLDAIREKVVEREAK